MRVLLLLDLLLRLLKLVKLLLLAVPIRIGELVDAVLFA